MVASSTGVISKAAFITSMTGLKPIKSMPQQEQRRAVAVLNTIFDLFDSDRDGAVDFVELASGITVLCGDAHDSKADAAFSLYGA